MSKNHFRVFVTCDIGPAVEVLRQRGYEVDVYPGPEAPSKKLLVEKVRSGIDGLITVLRDSLDAEVFEAGAVANLKVVSQVSVGVDNIKRADANRFRIPFTNTPDVLTDATAEFAFFMMGALARRLWETERMVRENRWGTWHLFLPFLGEEVTGKTIAVIGTGRIGQAMIKKCSGFDMNILCYNPREVNQTFVSAIQEEQDLRFARGLTREHTLIRAASLDQALKEADFVNIHVPLPAGRERTPTYHMFNEQIPGSLMKPTAFLVNTSRGPVVDEAALARAIKERWIGGAALDVYEKEPLAADSPLRDPGIEDRCRLYPHFGSAAKITRLSPDPDKGMSGRAVQGLIDVLEGNYGGDLTKMPFVVNKEAFQ